jgi:lia operon protein LiaG
MDRTNKLTRVVLITAAVTVAALGIAALIGLATSGFRWDQFGRNGITVDDTKTQTLDGVDSVKIDVVSDDVRITEGTGTALVARLHGTTGTRAADTMPKLVVERNGSTVNVRLTPERTFGFGFAWSTLSLDIAVPSGYAKSLAVKTVSGGVKVEDHSYAGLALSTTSGDVEVGTVSATDFSMRSTSGTLAALSVAAVHVELSSVSGDIRIKGLTGATKAHTTSGSVAIRYTSAPASVDASSTSGGVTLEMPADAGFALDAHSTSGDITCRFPITITQSGTGGGNHALSGTVGKGGGPVAVRTVSGDIRIEK